MYELAVHQSRELVTSELLTRPFTALSLSSFPSPFISFLSSTYPTFSLVAIACTLKTAVVQQSRPRTNLEEVEEIQERGKGLAELNSLQVFLISSAFSLCH